MSSIAAALQTQGWMCMLQRLQLQLQMLLWNSYEWLATGQDHKHGQEPTSQDQLRSNVGGCARWPLRLLLLLLLGLGMLAPC
jgi:hypothetical protein